MCTNQVSKPVLNNYVSGSDVRGQQGLFHWRCYCGLWTHILARNDGLKLKLLNDLFITNTQLFASEDDD